MRPRRLIRRMIRERFLITTAAGTFDGVLLDADRGHYVLADAAALKPDGERVQVDGHLWIPAQTVTYLQRPEV